MNALMFCFAICSYGVILSCVSGRRIHSGNSFYDHKVRAEDDSKYKLKQIFDVYSDNKNTDDPAQNKHLFKLNTNVPKKNLDVQKKYLNQGTYTETNKRKTLRTEVGKHLIKVTSALQSKHVELEQQKEGGYDISVKPKFSHVIEILPIEKENTAEKDEHSKVSEEFGKKEGKETDTETELYTDKTFENQESFDETESEPYGEEVETESEFYDKEDESEDYEESVETESEFYDEEDESEDYEESVETESEFYDEDDESEDYEESVENEHNFDVESETTKNSFNAEETVETEHIFDVESVSTKSSFNAESNTENTAVTGDIDLLSGDANKESAFIEGFEGSGEDSFNSEDSEDSKSGRLLGIFSRQNATAPNCTTPKGEPGHCRRMRQCILSDTLNNFNVFLQHLCLIRGALVGVCCPDNPVIEITDPDENNTVTTNGTDIKQPPEGCGLNVKTRIVGGSISVPHEWTWMVALLRRNRFYCGGVIINNWYILTAAHCVMGMNVKDLSVRLGEYDFNEDNKHQEDISVSEIKRHAQFVSLTFQHDIALLKLKRSIQYSKFVGSICLPDSKARDYSDVQGTVVGWGTVSFGGAASPVLRQVTVPIWKNADCDRTYFLENINDAFMCAGSPEKGEDACQGDSGGPLMAVNSRGRWEVIGLVSWGRRCGDPTYPGVYTRVTTYLDWIQENIN